MNPEHIAKPISRVMNKLKLKPLTRADIVPKRKKLKLKAPVVKEWSSQRTVFEWAKMMEGREPRLKLLNASMNGLKANPRSIVMAKLCGLKPGYPDIFLPVPLGDEHGHFLSGLFIEMKRVGATLTDNQHWWHDALAEQDYQVEIAFSAKEAIRTIANYLGIEGCIL